MGTMAYSRTMDTKGQKMIDRDFQTQARLSQHLKDVRLMLEAAAEAGLALPLSETHRRLLETAEAAGFGDADNSAVIEAFDSRAKAVPEPKAPPHFSLLSKTETRHD
jgi:3-hydroxyisobutyrate dehydrogenase-like beta-hydroxyacid dehydrogenase